jgi:hypothetical protein
VTSICWTKYTTSTEIKPIGVVIAATIMATSHNWYVNLSQASSQCVKLPFAKHVKAKINTLCSPILFQKFVEHVQNQLEIPKNFGVT